MKPARPRKVSSAPSPRIYGSVKELMKGEAVGAEVQKAYAQMEQATCITDALARFRRAAKLTQADMAKQLGVTQAAVSKIESGRDEALTLATIREYSAATNRRIDLTFGQPITHVEAVKEHALEIRRHLDALAALAHKDQGMEQHINAFFGEAFLNLLQIISQCQQQLPKRKTTEVRLQSAGLAALATR